MKEAIASAAKEHGGKAVGVGVALTILWGVVSKQMDKLEALHDEIHKLQVDMATHNALRELKQAPERERYE